MTHALTKERLARRGYYDISEAYKSRHSIGLNRRVLNGTHGGARGRLLNEWAASYPICKKFSAPGKSAAKEG